MTFRLYYYYVNAFGVYTQKTECHALVKSQQLSATLSHAEGNSSKGAESPH